MLSHLRLWQRTILGLLLGIIATISILVPASGFADDEILAQLSADYRKYELPRPSGEAQLVLRQHAGGTFNGVQQYSFDLVLQEKRDGKAVHWQGMFPEKPRGTIKANTVQPTVALVAKTTAGQSRRHQAGEQYLDLILAIHCHDRGWKEVADALLARSKVNSIDSWIVKRPKRPRDDRAALALAAWEYRCEQFIREPGDRTPILAHLKALAGSKLGLVTPARVNLIADMELTLAQPPKPANELEAAINSLIDLGKRKGDHDDYSSSIEWANQDHKGYGQLRDAGLAAVPVLVAHLDDYRLTRCRGSSGRGAWHARVADAVARLLDELATQPFSYDLLIAEGRGKQLDRAHVLHWWTELQGTKDLDYLTTHAVTVGKSGDAVANEAILRAMGQRYPSELVKLFPEKLPLVRNSYPLFDALEDSRAPQEEKARLFLAVAKDPKSSDRARAISSLLVLKHEQAVPLLIQELALLPRTPTRPYWLCEARQFPGLVVRSKDERAWKALRDTAQRVDLGQRMELIQAMGNCSEREDKALDFLADFLGDEEVRVIDPTMSKFPHKRNESGEFELEPFSGPCAGFIWPRLAVRDLAALELADILDIKVDRDALQDEKGWDGLRTQVTAALAVRNKKKGEEKQ